MIVAAAYIANVLGRAARDDKDAQEEEIGLHMCQILPLTKVGRNIPNHRWILGLSNRLVSNTPACSIEGEFSC